MAQIKLTDLPEITTATNSMEILIRDDAGEVSKIQRSNFVEGLASSGSVTGSGSSAGGGIGAGGAVEMTALGALTTGDSVIITADGKVSAISENATAVGIENENTASLLTDSNIWIHGTCYDEANGQSVVIYTVGLSSYYSFVSDVGNSYDIRSAVFTAHTGDPDSVVYQSSQLVATEGFFLPSDYLYTGLQQRIPVCVAGNKIIIWYYHSGGARYQVGTLSSGTVTWSSAVAFEGGGECLFESGSATFDKINSRIVIGFGQFQSGDFTLNSGSTVAWSRDAGQRTVGVYSLNGETLTLDGSLYQPTQTTPDSNQGSYNRSSGMKAVHGYSTKISWFNGGATLDTPLDLYFVSFDASIYVGYLNAYGIRTWSAEHEVNGGWASITADFRTYPKKALWTMDWFADDAALCYSHTYPINTGQAQGIKYAAVHKVNLYTPSVGGMPVVTEYPAGNDSWQNSQQFYQKYIVDPVYGNIAVLRWRSYATVFMTTSTRSAPASNYDESIAFPAQSILGEWVPSSVSWAMTFNTTVWSGEGHYDSANGAIIWFGTNGTDIAATVHRVGGTLDASNVTEYNFLGFSSADYNDGDTALILTIGAVETSHTGMTPATRMWVKADGTLAEIPQEIPAFAGTALTATKLLVRA